MWCACESIFSAPAPLRQKVKCGVRGTSSRWKMAFVLALELPYSFRKIVSWYASANFCNVTIVQASRVFACLRCLCD